MIKAVRFCFDTLIISVASVIPLILIALMLFGAWSLIAGPACSMEKLGTISRNPFIGDSTSNPFSMYNNPFSPKSPYNRFGPYGNRFSPYSWNNPYSMSTPGIYGHADEANGGTPDIYGYADGPDYNAYPADGEYPEDNLLGGYGEEGGY